MNYMVCGLTAITVWAVTVAVAPGQQVAPAPVKTTSFEELASLGVAVADSVRLKDNVFVYQEVWAKLHEIAASLSQARVEFTVAVEKVTQKEVFVTVPDAGKTRIALKHDGLPEYGNLRTVEYCGPPSVSLLRHFARRVSLRIGSEIQLELAKQLRRGDLVILQGSVESAELHAETAFNPIALVVISDWQVTGLVSRTAPGN
jgi:hypothetical protein